MATHSVGAPAPTSTEDLELTLRASKDTRRQFVKVVSIHEIGFLPTYNFDVAATKNYLVETGLVVHNCLDALSRLAEPGLILPKHMPEDEQKLMFADGQFEFQPIDAVMGY
jgi:hypothetical protein